jgi:hypothetical protein
MFLIIKLLVSFAVDGLLLESSLLAGLLVIRLTVKTRAPVHCLPNMTGSQLNA